MTANPDGAWVAQQARNLMLMLGDRARQLHFLLRDRDARFSRSFDVVFRSEGAAVLLTPLRGTQGEALGFTLHLWGSLRCVLVFALVGGV
jgi:hypothetical protein